MYLCLNPQARWLRDKRCYDFNPEIKMDYWYGMVKRTGSEVNVMYLT